MAKGKERLVYIEWLDSCGCSSHWATVQDDLEVEPVICKSVGWLLFESKKCLVVVPHLSHVNFEGGKSQGCGDMTIPKAAVIKIKDLSLKR